jgi:hypothetical protein
MAPLVGSENSTTGGPSRPPPWLHQIVRAGACPLPRTMPASAHRGQSEPIPGPLHVLGNVPPDTETCVGRATTSTCTRVLVCSRASTVVTYFSFGSNGFHISHAQRYCKYRRNTQEKCWHVICYVCHKRPLDDPPLETSVETQHRHRGTVKCLTQYLHILCRQCRVQCSSSALSGG